MLGPRLLQKPVQDALLGPLLDHIYKPKVTNPTPNPPLTLTTSTSPRSRTLTLTLSLALTLTLTLTLTKVNGPMNVHVHATLEGDLPIDTTAPAR